MVVVPVPRGVVNEIVAGIVDADYHHGGLRGLRVMRLAPEQVSTLRAEVESLLATQPSSDVTQPGHVTGWTAPFGRVAQYSLFNTSGRTDDYTSDHDRTRTAKRFAAGAKYPRLRELVESVPALVNFRVNVLGARSGLSAHEEHTVVRLPDGVAAIRARFHLPVITNERAELMLDGEIHHLEAGSLFFINNGCVHAARNLGEQPRAHLVWDLLLTPASLRAMFGEGKCPVAWLERIPPADRPLRPLRHDRIGPVRRLPPPVREHEARRLVIQ